MPTAPASPSLATPGPTAQALAKLASLSGIGLMCISVALALFHPVPDLQKELLSAGLGLAGSSVGIYGVLTTALKWVAMAKRFEPEAQAVAAMIPGAVGTDVQMALSAIHKLIDALPDSSAFLQTQPPPAPTAVAAAAGVAAAAAPAAAL